LPADVDCTHRVRIEKADLPAPHEVVDEEKFLAKLQFCRNLADDTISIVRRFREKDAG